MWCLLQSIQGLLQLAYMGISCMHLKLLKYYVVAEDILIVFHQVKTLKE